jgi:predicted AlkP superfamily phosphohydrolase/phosphomutase
VVTVPPFWRHLSDAGKRVGIVDVPLASLDGRINGLHVVEWGVHDALYGFRTTPTHLGAELLSRYGMHPVGSCCDGIRRSAQDYRDFGDRLISGIETKAKMARRLLAQGPWDFFMQVFSESHCVGHQCWHLNDAGHPAHDPAIFAEADDPVRRVYEALDRALGEIMADANAALVIVFSSHGMAHWYGAQFLLRDILFKLGAATPSPTPTVPVVAEIAGAAWRRLPDAVRQALIPLRNLARHDRPDRDSTPRLGVDTANSACLPLSNGLGTGGIRLNVAGREPTGILRPGPELESYVDSLGKDLLALVDAHTGLPLIRRVLRTAALYRGPHLASLPDLVVEWSDATARGSAAVGRGQGAEVVARSSRLGEVRGVNHYGRTGEHRPDGLFVAAGPTVRTGPLDAPISVLDLAPTFCDLVGVPASGFDGVPIRLY